jgi:sec-independent protein translocase protein TatA
MLKGAFEGWHIIILLVLLVVLFGFKRLPDAARSLGRSMRIFKSEVSEMKNDGKSAASSDTVKGETVRDEPVRDEPVRDQPIRTPAPESTTPARDDAGPREDNSSGIS